jgi:ribonuclease BN (tRNA processing enzyme)
MRVVFLGTGGYHPNHRRHTAGVLLPEVGLLFDAGTGLFRLSERLVRDDLTIALTHAHLDHVCGLTYLLVPLHCGRLRRLRVLGTRRTLGAVREHLFAGPIFPVLPEGEWTAIDELARIELAPGVVLTHRPLPSHPGESVAYRLDWTEPPGRTPRSLAYVTDTCVDGTYTDFVRGVDLLIHECYFPDELQEWAARTGHSYTSTVARLAREAEVAELIFTHIDPQRDGEDPIGLDVARAIFPHTRLAEDLMECVVGGATAGRQQSPAVR